MEKIRILIPVSCRSDEGLSAPIIKELQSSNKFDVDIIRIRPNYLKYVHEKMSSIMTFVKSDIVFITGDRPEMCAAAFAAFHMNVPIAHYFAGIISPAFMTYDCIDRHCITLWSDIQFVESKICMLNVEMLLQSIKKESNCRVVGITHLENLQISEKLVPKYSYNLILYNIPSRDHVEVDYLFEMVKKYNTRPIIWIGSNPDGDNTVIKSVISKMLNVKFYDDIPRNEFLGLLKNCSEFISNSSVVHYEAPYFLEDEQIIPLGIRNHDRTQSFFDRFNNNNTSKLIRKHLINWWKNEH